MGERVSNNQGPKPIARTKSQLRPELRAVGSVAHWQLGGRRFSLSKEVRIKPPGSLINHDADDGDAMILLVVPILVASTGLVWGTGW